jgi:Ca2+-transporting ATPase
MLWDQFASLIVALLVAASAVAFAFGEVVEGVAIAAVIFLNAGIGFVTERRAVRSMEALRELGHTTATVRRDGSVLTLSASAIVPGDIVVLEAGDILTADVRLLSASRLQADESPLTGESLPVDKGVDPAAPDAPLAERASMLFKGTAVTRGAGEGAVVATGMATELGHISALVEQAEPETTPLEKRLDRLGRRLIGLTLVIAAVVAVAIIASGRELYLAVEIAIALAVATIPEGLPIVATVALARGMWRMARRNALVEQLAAVETLGSTTVILTDKTGTLTENRMTAVELRLADRSVRVDGTGLETSGTFRTPEAAVVPSEQPQLLEALRVGVLCSDATLETGGDGEARATGDPTEVALLVAGAKAGLDRAQLLRECPEVFELAFDPDTKRMATLHDREGALFAAVKGAPESVIECCTSVRTETGTQPLGSAERTEWLGVADEMAASGERVLALATAPARSAQDFDYEDLILLGLVGLFDPPRARVRDAIDACQDAGIRVIMVTGDHGATGWTVAAAVGLIDPEPGAPISFLDGRDLPALDEVTEARAKEIRDAPVIARATPSQKLDLIELHQRAGAVVAMTGDGVNDAPALKKADIGVAMGLRGSQVAREAADMVLRDDELATIVAAVAQGRAAAPDPVPESRDRRLSGTGPRRWRGEPRPDARPAPRSAGAGTLPSRLARHLRPRRSHRPQRPRGARARGGLAREACAAGDDPGLPHPGHGPALARLHHAQPRLRLDPQRDHAQPLDLGRPRPVPGAAPRGRTLAAAGNGPLGREPRRIGLGAGRRLEPGPPDRGTAVADPALGSPRQHAHARRRRRHRLSLVGDRSRRAETFPLEPRTPPPDGRNSLKATEEGNSTHLARLAYLPGRFPLVPVRA